MEESEAIPIFGWRTGGEYKGERCAGQRAVVAFLPLILLLLLCLYFWQQKTVIVMEENGNKQFSTFCRTIGEFLEEKELPVGDYDQLIPDREEKVVHGQVVSIKRAFPITMKVDGDSWKVWTCSLTAADLLREQEVELRGQEKIFPAPGTVLNPPGRQRIRMVQVARGDRRGLPLVTDRWSRVLGNVSYRSLLGTPLNMENRRPALTETAAVKTAAPVQAGRGTYKTKIISALAEKKIFPVETASAAANEETDLTVVKTISRGGLDWGIKEVLEVTATAYCPGTAEAGCPIDARGASQCTGFYNDGYTATGIRAVAGDGSKANPHLIAVDPAVIPLKSLVYIEGYGFARAEDTGSAIKGKSIDLLFQKHKDAWNFGRKKLKIYLLPESV
jgi:3D (Asp-Asp-Asp) domain-containing protein